MKRKINKLINSLFPLNRSLAGSNNLKSLLIIKKNIPIKIKRIKSGTKVFDWKVPHEWNLKGAILKNNNTSKTLIDSKNSNLHVVSYSKPINKIVKWNELKKHLHYDKKYENAIPYRTSYYSNNWGMSVTYKQYQKIKNSKGPYKIIINSSFKKGYMHYGELLIKGKSRKEILISTYICHPSLANDNLSGIIVTNFITEYLLKKKSLHYSYRIVFHPETIGAIAYSFINKEKIKKIDFGTVITCTGGKENFSYKESYNKNHFINYLLLNLFKKKKITQKKYEYDVVGSDERQYSSQGFGINIISIFKGKYYEYSNYHLSTDNLNYVTSENLIKSINFHKNFFDLIEKTPIYQTKNKECEIMLSKYNLYDKLGGGFRPNNKQLSNQHLYLWMLYLFDGSNTIEMIAEKLKEKKSKIKKMSEKLLKLKLIYRV